MVRHMFSCFSFRFRWVYCQLEILRNCLPSSVRRVLAELPETLDETYERILQEIPKSNRVHAHRLLQCLAVAIRPLRVEELAEILAVDFTAEGELPKLNEDLRWEDRERAVLSACSTLITIVEDRGLRVVQFSHFSVKEFLTSDRLATSTIDTSRYHYISLERSHTIMAQACLSVLLRLDHEIGNENIGKFPLAEYAAQYLGDHAEFEGVLSHIQDGIDDLLDADKPYFATWLCVRHHHDHHPQRPKGTPLYFVAGFGFVRLVQHLISRRPEDICAKGEYGTPLHAASLNGHLEILQLLLGHYADVDVRDLKNQTPLHVAVDNGLIDVIQLLIGHNADINARDNNGQTPLYRTVTRLAIRPKDRDFDVAKFLLEHGADVEAKDNDDSTPLHAAAYYGSVKAVELLLGYGANIRMRNKMGQTPLHQAVDDLQSYVEDYYLAAIRFLLDHGAEVDAQDNDHSTPLHVASYDGSVKAARLLLEYGASSRLQNNEGQTPFQVACTRGHEEFAQLLSEHLYQRREKSL